MPKEGEGNMKKKRGKNGRFVPTSFCYIDGKGYPCISAGPLRGIRLHRIIAAAKLGRPLKHDEDVHHKDYDKLNPHPDNLEVLGHKEHGCVSAKQHHYIKEHDIEIKSEWDEWFDAERSGGGKILAFHDAQRSEPTNVPVGSSLISHLGPA